MEIRVSLAGGDEEELRSLYAWLREEPDVRHHALIDLESPSPRPGEMGTGVVDVIKLITDTGFQGLNLALAWQAWRASRRSTAKVVVELDGDKTVISGDDPDAVRSIVAALDGSAKPDDE